MAKSFGKEEGKSTQFRFFARRVKSLIIGDDPQTAVGVDLASLLR